MPFWGLCECMTCTAAVSSDASRDIERAALQGLLKSLIGWIEEVQPFDAVPYAACTVVIDETDSTDRSLEKSRAAQSGCGSIS